MFAEHQHTYGSRRMRCALAKRGLALSRDKVRKLLNAFALKTCWKRKFVHPTDRKHTLPVADNLLNREFTPKALNQAWTSDITDIRTRSGWRYLAVVMDLCSHRGFAPGCGGLPDDALQPEAFVLGAGRDDPGGV